MKRFPSIIRSIIQCLIVMLMVTICGELSVSAAVSAPGYSRFVMKQAPQDIDADVVHPTGCDRFRAIVDVPVPRGGAELVTIALADSNSTLDTPLATNVSSGMHRYQLPPLPFGSRIAVHVVVQIDGAWHISQRITLRRDTKAECGVGKRPLVIWDYSQTTDVCGRGQVKAYRMLVKVADAYILRGLRASVNPTAGDTIRVDRATVLGKRHRKAEFILFGTRRSQVEAARVAVRVSSRDGYIVSVGFDAICQGSDT